MGNNDQIVSGGEADSMSVMWTFHNTSSRLLGNTMRALLHYLRRLGHRENLKTERPIKTDSPGIGVRAHIFVV